MATAHEMAEFDANARYIHVINMRVATNVALRSFDLSNRDKNMLEHQLGYGAVGSGAVGARIPECSIQLRDRSGRLCWVQTRQDPLGILHASLRYQADEWAAGQEPHLTENEQEFAWARHTNAKRHQIADLLRHLSHSVPAEPELYSKQEIQLSRGNNPVNEPAIEPDYTAVTNPFIIGGKPVPAHSHHFTTQQFEGFLKEHRYPPSTIADRLREHQHTLKNALLFSRRLPRHVMDSEEGRQAISDAISEARARALLGRQEALREHRADLTSTLLASLADQVDETRRHVGRRPVTAALLWAARDASTQARVATADTAVSAPAKNTSLLLRALGRSAENVLHALIPFPMRITFVTRFFEAGADQERLPTRAAGRSLPPPESCALVVEDARQPFGNVWATMASYSADEVNMAMSDMIHEGQITPAQAEHVVGSAWMAAHVRRPIVDVLTSPPAENQRERIRG